MRPESRLTGQIIYFQSSAFSLIRARRGKPIIRQKVGPRNFHWLCKRVWNVRRQLNERWYEDFTHANDSLFSTGPYMKIYSAALKCRQEYLLNIKLSISKLKIFYENIMHYFYVTYKVLEKNMGLFCKLPPSPPPRVVTIILKPRTRGSELVSDSLKFTPVWVDTLRPLLIRISIIVWGGVWISALELNQRAVGVVSRVGRLLLIMFTIVCFS